MVAEVSKTLDPPKSSNKLEDFDKIIPPNLSGARGDLDITVDFTNILLEGNIA